MKGWLLDTNVISELRRARPEQRVMAFFRDAKTEHMYVSTVTLMEIRFGVASATELPRRLELDS